MMEVYAKTRVTADPQLSHYKAVWKIMQWIKLNQKLWKPPEHQSCCFFSSKVNIWVNKFPAIWMHLLKSVFRRNRKLYSSETRPSLQKKRKKASICFLEKWAVYEQKKTRKRCLLKRIRHLLYAWYFDDVKAISSDVHVAWSRIKDMDEPVVSITTFTRTAVI